jgi:DNA-binding response OmpR family regulator
MSRVLLLEPNRWLAQQYSGFLEAAGYEVTWRQKAQDAIEVADTLKPNLVILDLILAGHSGIEFIYEFRSYADWQAVPILILSSVPKPEAGMAETTLKELGISGYLYKSEISLEKLGREVQRLLASLKA